MRRLAPPSMVLGRRRVEELLFALRAPVVGWRLATKGTSLARCVPIVEAMTHVRRGGPCELVALARTVEGGAEPRAYFQQLLAWVREGLRRDASIAGELLMLVLTLTAMLAMVASLGWLGPASTIILGMGGALGMLVRPPTHYATVDEKMEATAVALAAAVGLAVSAWMRGPGLAVGMLVYGLATAPALLTDVSTWRGWRVRVLATMNELLTKPNPSPMLSLTPVEEELQPLHAEARDLGAPEFVGWANALVAEYVASAGTAELNALIYGIATATLGAGLGIFIPHLIESVLTATMQQYVAQYIGSIIGNVGLGGYYAVVGAGLAGGSTAWDWRVGAIVGGLAGLIAWFVLVA